MGKGSIEAGGAEGLYTVRLHLDRTRIDQRLAELEKTLAFLESQELPRLEAEVQAAQAALTDAQAAVDSAIAGQDLDAMNAAAHRVAQAAGERDRKAAARDLVKLRRLALEREHLTLQARMPADPALQLWCADVSEDLSGTVATVEIPGERGGIPPLIRPGFNGAAAYSPARDGQLQPALAGTAWSVFYNWGLLAGWQTFQPAYRLGTITALEGDTCTVDLDTALSSAQSLPINTASNLTGVPIVYMDCNGAAFEVNDRVVVEFQGQDIANPRVIGFESHPRPCKPIQGLACKPISESANKPYAVLVWKTDHWIDHQLADEMILTGLKKEVFEATNAEREGQGLVPFRPPLHSALDAAQLHAGNMAATDIFAHADLGFPEGEQTVEERVRKNDHVHSFGENIAAYGIDYNEGLGPSGAEIVADWKASPEHWTVMTGFNNPDTEQYRTHLFIGEAHSATWRYFVQVMIAFRPAAVAYGAIDWKGHYAAGLPTESLTFQGPDARQVMPENDDTDFDIHGNRIFQGGRVFSKVPYQFVRGTAITEIDGAKWVVAIAQEFTGEAALHVIRRPAKRSESSAWYDPDTAPQGWQTVADFSIADSGGARTWFFDGTGTRAVNLRKGNRLASVTIHYGMGTASVELDPADFPSKPSGGQWRGADFIDQTPVGAYALYVENHYLNEGKTEPQRHEEDIALHLICGSATHVYQKTVNTYVQYNEDTTGSYDETAIKHQIFYLDPREELIISLGAEITASSGGRVGGWALPIGVDYAITARVTHGSTTSSQNCYAGTEAHSFAMIVDSTNVAPWDGSWTITRANINLTFLKSQVSAATDLGGRRLLTVLTPYKSPYELGTAPDLTKTYPRRTYNWLDGGDVLAVTGLTGDHPRFYPVGVI